MADEPTGDKFSGFLHRKVAGIPVLYLLIVVVVILVVVALRMRKTKAAPNPGGATDAATANTSEDQPAFFVPPANSQVSGNAATTPGASTTSIGSTGMPVPPTNDQWSSEAITWLLGQGFSLDVAQPAIENYLNSQPLTSADQIAARNAAINQFGQPPEPVPYGGLALSPSSPPETVGDSTPPPTDSKGSNPAPTPVQSVTKPTVGSTYTGNATYATVGQLAEAAYGNKNEPYRSTIVAANPGIPHGSDNNGSVIGIAVHIPPYNPRYWTVPAAGPKGPVQIAAKNGTSDQQIHILNPGHAWPARTGDRIRIA